MSEVLIKVDNVSKKFCKDLKRSLWYGMTDIARSVMGGAPAENLREGEFWAVRDVSFEVRRGECLGLIGHNGAGKSTLLKMLNGLINPDEGRIEMHGKIGALIELGAGFNPILTGRENVYNNGAVLGFSKAEIDRKFDDIVAFAEIEDFIDMPVQNYSSGMKVRLGFAIASQMEPDILIIDEVLAVGDVGFRMKCYDVIYKLIRNGTSIILVSHNMIDIARLASNVILLKAGHIYLKTNNIALAIQKYELIGKILKVNNSKSNGIEITNLEIINKDKEKIKTGDDLKVKVLLKNSLYPIKDSRVIVHIESPSLGHLGSFSSPYKNKFFDLPFGNSEIHFTIYDLPLLQGAYFLNVAINGKNPREHYHWFRQAYTFSVIDPPTETLGYGLAHNIYFKHSWE